jgi:hypothetical protein
MRKVRCEKGEEQKVKTIQLRPAGNDRPAVVLAIPDDWRRVTRGKTRTGDLWYCCGASCWVHVTPGVPVNGAVIRRDAEV